MSNNQVLAWITILRAGWLATVPVVIATSLCLAADRWRRLATISSPLTAVLLSVAAMAGVVVGNLAPAALAVNAAQSLALYAGVGCAALALLSSVQARYLELWDRFPWSVLATGICAAALAAGEWLRPPWLGLVAAVAGLVGGFPFAWWITSPRPRGPVSRIGNIVHGTKHLLKALALSAPPDAAIFAAGDVASGRATFARADAGAVLGVAAYAAAVVTYKVLRGPAATNPVITSDRPRFSIDVAQLRLVLVLGSLIAGVAAGILCDARIVADLLGATIILLSACFVRLAPAPSRGFARLPRRGRPN